eukprot:jgi/Ulvmu1/7551/UM037_0095.1
MATSALRSIGTGIRRNVMALKSPMHASGMNQPFVLRGSSPALTSIIAPPRRCSVSDRFLGTSCSAGRSCQSNAKRQLILAVDNSKDSQYAVDWTLANFYRNGDKLHVVHCLPGQPVDVLSVTGMGVPVERLPYKQEQKVQLDQARKTLAEMYSDRMAQAEVDYEFNVVCEEGAAFGAGIGDNIVSMAAEVDATAVVVSSHRKSMLAEFMMGSISNFLVHQCEKPVIVLHAPRLEASMQHLKTTDTRNIVLAVDTSARSEKMADWTIQNVTRPGDHVHALHVIPAIPSTPVYQVYAEGMVSVLPGPSDEDVEAHRARLHADLETRLNALLPADGSVKMSVHVIEEDAVNPMESVGSAICHKAEELNAAALVCMSGHKGPIQELFMGSVSSYLSHKSETPVLVLE